MGRNYGKSVKLNNGPARSDGSIEARKNAKKNKATIAQMMADKIANNAITASTQPLDAEDYYDAQVDIEHAEREEYPEAERDYEMEASEMNAAADLDNTDYDDFSNEYNGY